MIAREFIGRVVPSVGQTAKLFKLTCDTQENNISTIYISQP